MSGGLGVYTVHGVPAAPLQYQLTNITLLALQCDSQIEICAINHLLLTSKLLCTGMGGVVQLLILRSHERALSEAMIRR